MMIDVRAAFPKSMFDSYSTEEMEEFKRNSLRDKLYKKISQLIDEGYFDVKSRFINDGPNDSEGIEYCVQVMLLNGLECDELEKRLKNKKK